MEKHPSGEGKMLKCSDEIDGSNAECLTGKSKTAVLSSSNWMAEQRNHGSSQISSFLWNYIFGEADVTIQSGFDWWTAYGNIKGCIGVLGQMAYFYQSTR